jgi:hypothetical protein
MLRLDGELAPSIAISSYFYADYIPRTSSVEVFHPGFQICCHERPINLSKLAEITSVAPHDLNRYSLLFGDHAESLMLG